MYIYALQISLLVIRHNGCYEGTAVEITREGNTHKADMAEIMADLDMR